MVLLHILRQEGVRAMHDGGLLAMMQCGAAAAGALMSGR